MKYLYQGFLLFVTMLIALLEPLATVQAVNMDNNLQPVGVIVAAFFTAVFAFIYRFFTDDRSKLLMVLGILGLIGSVASFGIHWWFHSISWGISCLIGLGLVSAFIFRAGQNSMED